MRQLRGLKSLSFGRLRIETVLPLAVALITFLVFSGVLRNGFVNWDDNVNFPPDYHCRSLGWVNLRWMFALSSGVTYDPLVMLLVALTYAIWGMNPLGYHLAGIMVHVAVAVALYHTTVCLLRSTALIRDNGSEAALRWSAAVATLLFALHPLRVEAVAWASGQHHALSSLFFLISIWSYLKSRGPQETHRRWLRASLISYALCLLSGPVGVTLPVVLLILDAYLPKCLDAGTGKSDLWANLREKTPFFIIAAMGCLATMKMRAEHGHFVTLAQHGVAQRLAQALFGLAFYLRKTLAPWGLSPLYPLPRVDVLAGPILLSGSIVAAITVVALAARRRWPSGLAVWSYYIVTLTPVLGFTQFGLQIVADRYTYLSSFGFSVLAAGALARLGQESGRRAWRNAVVIAGMFLGALSCMTWREIKVWRDPENLWGRVLALYPDYALAHNNLAVALAAEGKIDEAIRHYNLALKTNPDIGLVHNDLGVVLAERGQFDEAIRHYNLALKAQPDYAEAHNNLALVLAKQGKTDEAVAQYNLALQEFPDYPEAHYNLGELLAKQGKVVEEIRQFELAIRARSDYAEAHNNLGIVLYEQGKINEAALHFDLAIRARPDYAEAHNNLGGLLGGQGRIDEAILQFDLALKTRPDYADAHNNLGGVLARKGKKDEAIRHFRRAIEIDPGHAAARGNLALLLKEFKPHR